MLPFEGSSEANLLNIYLTTYFRSGIILNTSAMWIMSFWKMSKIYLILKNEKNIAKKVFVSQIIVCELAPLNCLY